jgi:GDP-L-fucose synthase
MSIYPKIYVAGHRGMVGSAIVRQLVNQGHPTDSIVTMTHAELDLTDQTEVRAFFAAEKPDQVYLAAAKVGGIHANRTFPAEFIYQNLMIATNVIDAAFRSGVKKLLSLGSSCIYPKLTPQPIPEDALLCGALEPTNEPYAIAKIAAVKLCESYNRQYGNSHDIDYRSLMPTSLYGPGDNYHAVNSHVIPALISRFHEAMSSGFGEVAIWGSGNQKREFLFVNDLADASIFVMGLPRCTYQTYTEPMLGHVNVGSGEEISIAELAKVVAQVVGFQGRIVFDTTRPEGTPRKLLNSGKIRALGWRPTMGLRSGLVIAYADFLQSMVASD